MEKFLWIVMALIVLMAVVATLAAIFGGYKYNGSYVPYGMMGSGYTGMIIFMPIIGIVSVIFVLLFIYFFFEMFRDSSDNHHRDNYSDVEKIVKERYARGEISEDDYNKMISNLRK